MCLWKPLISDLPKKKKCPTKQEYEVRLNFLIKNFVIRDFPFVSLSKKNLANSELIKFFSKCKDGKVRSVKISIENGELLIGGLDREMNGSIQPCPFFYLKADAFLWLNDSFMCVCVRFYHFHS